MLHLLSTASYAKQHSFNPVSIQIQSDDTDNKTKRKVLCKLIDVNPTVLCGQGNWFIDPTIIMCITGLRDLYYEILYLYLTNYKLKKLRCLVILSKEDNW